MNISKSNIFQLLILTARPAAGKSEIIQYLMQTPERERQNRFHVGKIKVIDDFPFLWRWFEEDSILDSMSKPRLYTDNGGYFKHQYYWDLLINLINLEYEKFCRDTENVHEYTVIVEFSRGKEHGGYRNALTLLSPKIIANCSLMHINVSWEESLRKNKKRFNPKKPDSILEHGLSDEKLMKLYYECDFNEIAPESNGVLSLEDIRIPYVKFENNDDVTTSQGTRLSDQLNKYLSILWNLN